MARLLLAVLALAMLATAASGQSCSTNATEAACYAVEASCHYDPVLSVCAEGAPATCEQRYRNNATCTGSCAVNLFNAQCYLVPTAAPLSANASTFTNRSDCVANGFYFDLYMPSNTSTEGECVSSLAEVKSLFPTCATYNNYPLPGVNATDACSNAGGCFLLNGTRICIDSAGSSSSSSSTAGPEGSSSSSSTAGWNETAVLNGTNVIYTPDPEKKAANLAITLGAVIGGAILASLGIGILVMLKASAAPAVVPPTKTAGKRAKKPRRAMSTQRPSSTHISVAPSRPSSEKKKKLRSSSRSLSSGDYEDVPLDNFDSHLAHAAARHHYESAMMEL